MYAASTNVGSGGGGCEKRVKKQVPGRSLTDRLRTLIRKKKKNAPPVEEEIPEEGTNEPEPPVGRYKPESLDTLVNTTRYTRKELTTMYRGFKQECPSGLVDEDLFKQIYAQFFPQGDSKPYAHFVFKAFDKDGSGSLSFDEFVVALSMLSRGSLEEKLQWAFSLYDIDGDGMVTRDEFTQIVTAIYDMMGQSTYPPVNNKLVQDHVSQVYERVQHLDHGPLNMEQFSELCRSNNHMLAALHVFDTHM